MANKNDMSSTQIKDILINTFKKSAEKSVQDAAYDKTILATIQYCADATIGQYKIKYQNGYYTAYSKDNNTLYTNGALVYVLVPGNNMNNRMFISGLASNDNRQKVYVSSLEGDQQYYSEGSNYILGLTSITNNLNMSTYDAPNKLWVRTLYNLDDTRPECIQLIDGINDYLKEAEYIRIGAKFQTSIAEDRRYGGNYGLVFKFKYKSASTQQIYFKEFVLDTFNMSGTPFNFTVAMPQYVYFELPPEHKQEFLGVESIREFVQNFPDYETLPSDKYDIKVSDLSLHKAIKLYNTNDNIYKLAIISEDNFNFGTGADRKDNIYCSAELRVNGNAVKESSGQNVEYYWAKEDVSVNNINHAKYNKYTGKGWYCLNKSSKTNYQPGDDIQNYTILQDDINTPAEYVLWDSNAKQIKINRTLFNGKKIRLKCVAVYENTTVPSEIKTIINPDGYYLLINSDGGKVTSANGRGNFTLTAGVFKDEDSDEPVSHTLDEGITYEWVELDELKNENNLPSQVPEDILLSELGWDEDEDNVDKTDEEVAAYLSEHPESYAVCIERYNYYDDQVTIYSRIEEPAQSDVDKLNTATVRRDNIITQKLADISELYINDINNFKYYIFGPSETTGQYTAQPHDYKNAAIASTTRYYYGTSEYESHANQLNTLYLLPASKIKGSITYRVSAIKTENGQKQSIGTEEIILNDSEQPSLRYELEIVNGTNSFIYDTAGKKPDIAIPPLTFRLYDNEKDHELIYDSAVDDSEQEYNLTMLKPKWIFYNYNNTMLKNDYRINGDTVRQYTGDDKKYELTKNNKFICRLADNFNENYRNSNNIILQITIDNEIVTAVTNFLFLKQGDLSTNGTGLALNIINSSYEDFKNVLANPEYSNIDGRNYTPDERHLKNTYLYATMCYNADGTQASDARTGREDSSKYVNLRFPLGGTTFHATDRIDLTAQWWQNGQALNVDDNNTVWSFEDCTNEGSGANRKIYRDYYGNKCYLKPDLTLAQDGTYKSKCSVSIDYIDANVGYTYIPSRIDNITIRGTDYDYKVSNDLVKVKASKDVIQGNNNDMIKRNNYGYYPMPYFYFNYTKNNPMPDNINPATHIVITGGFDEIKYDSAGANPEYNKQEPFCFHLFDENHNDITQEILNNVGVDGHSVYIKWTVSNGLIKTNTMTPTIASQIPQYENISNTAQLLGQYCIYNNKYYKCIQNYTKSQTISIDEGDDVIHTYEPGDFVTPYWEEADLNVDMYQKCSVAPVDTYETLAQADLFNSWIDVFVQYKKDANTTYQAEAFLPINVFCNKYGSQEINNWDGKKTIVDDGYMISSKIAAGIKEENNTFRGITIGTNFYQENNSRNTEVGLFGYGLTKRDQQGNWDSNSWARTIFLDSDTGRAIFGPSGATQIILDPRVVDNPQTSTTQIWSRIAGWYISPDYFYKPIGENTEQIQDYYKNYRLSKNYEILPSSGQGSIGMYCPSYKTVDDEDIWLWAGQDADVTYNNKAKANFKLTYGGKLYCKEADIEGSIKASSGFIGSDRTNGIQINYVKDNKSYIIYNPYFYVRREENNSCSVMVKGDIRAKSGQFGRVDEDVDGTSPGVVFVEYSWFPWHLPADNEEWNNETMYEVTTEGKSCRYALYSKYFYITNSGDTVFKGTLFAKKGRIGDWVIKSNRLCSTDETVYLSSTSGLRLGTFYARPDGSIGNQGQWWITADGRASFANIGNEFTGKSFTTADGTTMGEGGLRLGPGDKFFIGADDNTYMVAGNNGFRFNGYTTFTGKMTLDNSDIDFTGGSGTVTVNSSGVSLGSSGGQYKLYVNGNASLNEVNVKSLTINNSSLDDYIKSVINATYIMNVVGNRFKGSFAYPDADWSNVKGRSQAVNITPL